ncbi:monocarboxylate transporter 13-like [Candoia aspera]|uniref:monocarboxylate transporter 13-like n=1 Tax=Candoia aspera TaxID=51853 RepID=UPI002FD868DA
MGPPQASAGALDGGWGWAIVLATFLQSALVFGIIRSFGVFFLEFTNYFEEASGTTSWIPSVTLATLMGTSPLASALGTRYGERPVAIAGGILSGLGFLAASFATSLAQLYLFIGLLTGTGGALIFSPSLALLARYFDRRRALANSVAFSGTGIASLAFSPLFQFLVDTYGWRGALLLVAGMAFHLVPCGALLRPLPQAENSPAPPSTDSRGGKLATLLGLPLLSQRDFQIFGVAGVLIITGYFVPFVHLLPHAWERGFDEYQAAFLVSAVGIADIAGRIVAGWLAGCRGPLRLSHHLAIWTLLTGSAMLALSLGGSYVALMVLSTCYGFLASAVIPLKFSSLVEIVGTEQVMGAIGVIHLLESVAALAGPPLSGWIRDVTGSYHASFLVGGGFVIAGGFSLLLLPNFFSCCHLLALQNSGDKIPRDSQAPSRQKGTKTGLCSVHAAATVGPSFLKADGSPLVPV